MVQETLKQKRDDQPFSTASRLFRLNFDAYDDHDRFSYYLRRLVALVTRVTWNLFTPTCIMANWL